MIKKFLLPLCFVCLISKAFSQVKIGNNPNTISAASLLELESINQGFVLPRVALVNTTSPAPLAATLLTGTMVFSTSNPTGGSGIGLYYWDGTTWNFIATASSSIGNSWLLLGNAGTTPGTNFIGTTDANDFVIKTSNIERARVFSGSGVGIGTTTQLASALLSLKAGNLNTFLSTDNNTNWQAANASGIYQFFLNPRDAGFNSTDLNYGIGGFQVRTNGSNNTMFLTDAVAGAGGYVFINPGGTAGARPTGSASSWLEVSGNTAQTAGSNGYEALIKLDAAQAPVGSLYTNYNSTAAKSYIGMESYLQNTPGTKQAIALNEYGGNVGIGTSNPTSLLHVKAQNGANNAFLNLDNGSGASQSGIQLMSTGTTKSNIYFDPTVATYGANGAMLLNNVGGSSPNTVLNPTNGNVGIGVNIPTKTLDVNGSINTGKASTTNGSLQFSNSTNANTVTINSGITAPTYAMTLPTAQGANNQVMTNNGAGVLSWASPTASIANNAYFAYGTASNTINNTAGNGVFTPLSGLSITVNLTGTAVVWVHTDGGLQTQSFSATGFSVIDIAMLNNGALFANGGYERVTVVNNGGVVTVLGFWSKDEIVTLAAGSYTFSVSASRSLGSIAVANGNNTLVTQGTLAASVYYQ